MRELANKVKIVEFMRLFGRKARRETRVYLTGGATAVLKGWRDTTIDVDLKFSPEFDELFRSIPDLKETLHINVELAAPSDFIPAVPGWEERSQFIDQIGKVSFYHYDPYSQALSKIERSHDKDLSDVDSMIRSGLVDRKKLHGLFLEIEPLLYKYPAIDPVDFAQAVHRITNLTAE